MGKGKGFTLSGRPIDKSAFDIFLWLLSNFWFFLIENPSQWFILILLSELVSSHNPLVSTTAPPARAPMAMNVPARPPHTPSVAATLLMRGALAPFQYCHIYFWSTISVQMAQSLFTPQFRYDPIPYGLQYQQYYWQGELGSWCHVLFCYFVVLSYLQKRLARALFVLLLSTLACYQPTELIWAFLFRKFFNFTAPPPQNSKAYTLGGRPKDKVSVSSPGPGLRLRYMMGWGVFCRFLALTLQVHMTRVMTQRKRALPTPSQGASRKTRRLSLSLLF